MIIVCDRTSKVAELYTSANMVGDYFSCQLFKAQPQAPAPSRTLQVTEPAPTAGR